MDKKGVTGGLSNKQQPFAADQAAQKAKKEQDRKRQARAATDEEEELRRAIEESKKTAVQEEKIRATTKSKPDDGFNMDFDKFNTANNMGGDDLDGFDFGGAPSKKEEKKDDDGFNFNFDDKKTQEKKPDNGGGGDNLLDLFSGDNNAVSQQPGNTGQNALDFFN